LRQRAALPQQGQPWTMPIDYDDCVASFRIAIDDGEPDAFVLQTQAPQCIQVGAMCRRRLAARAGRLMLPLFEVSALALIVLAIVAGFPIALVLSWV
jgi:hypothetical protein